MFNYGAFRKGYVDADTRYKNQRRENARLYNEYVKMNPDASVEDREKYASDLAGNSEFFRAALPSADVMRSNVDRRKKEVEWQETQRRNQTLQTELGFMKSYADILTPFATSGDMQSGFDMLKEVGGFNPKMEKAVTAMAMGAASQGAISTINGRINAWKATGFQQDKIEDIFAGLNPNLPAVQQARTQVDAMTKSEIKRQAEALQADANRAAGNDEDFNMLKQNAAEKYPLLPAGRHDEIIANYGQQKFDARKQAESDANQAAVNQAFDKVRVALETDDIIGIDQAKERLESILAQTTLEDKSYDEERLAELVRSQEQRNIQRADEAEEQQLQQAQAKNENNRSSLTSDKDVNDRIDAVVDSLITDYSSFDKDFDLKTAKMAKRAEVEKALSTASQYGINLDNPDMVRSVLAEIAAEERSTTGSLEDPLAIQRAVGRAMSSPVAMNQLGTIDRKAFGLALEAMGVTDFSEVPQKSMTLFGNYYQQFRQAEYKTVFDKIDPEILNVTELGDMFKSTLDNFDASNQEKVGANDYTSRSNAILKSDVNEMKDVTSLTSHLKDGERRLTEAGNMILEIDRKIAMAQAYMRAPTKENAFGFGAGIDNIPKIEQVRDYIKQLQAKRVMVDGQMDQIVADYNKVEAMIGQAKNAGMDTMLVGDASAIKTLAPELGDELEGKSPQQQIEIINAKAEEITKQMIIAWTEKNPRRSLKDGMEKGELKNVTEVAQELFNAYLPQQ